MTAKDIRTTLLDRRRFLGITGGVAAAGVVAAACGDSGGSYIKPAGAASASAAGAATPTASASSDHSAPMPTASGRPKASGKLATVRDATLKPAGPGANKTLLIETKDIVHEVAAGVQMNAWSFDGVVPGNIVHVRQGDAIDFTLRNSSSMGHSIDFHAAQTPWNINYKTIVPGQELKFAWKANFPGVFMYHCGTGPVLQHIANGMYGAVIVDPAQPFAPAREYALVQSEFYLSSGAAGNWDGDLSRAQAVTPDFVVFNGAANQYQQQPLPASPGELIRLHVMNAGPTLFSAFHVIGTIFDRVYPDGNPANVLRGVSTWTIPPGGGATFELTIPDAGQYPFVTHSFAYTGLGAVGLIEVK
ncbi:MAG TPA: multicopper oxidase domain-containing protein [Dehalococcoidia bacterium]|nr:multicopper oxidase domain-containing protein [Dehalococcoidia bacterium]